MKCLVDTNVLLRWVDPGAEDHERAVSAVARLVADGVEVTICPQIAAEFWNVTTRPDGNGGRGLSPAEALQELSLIEELFEVLPDGEDVYLRWKRLVVDYGVCGVRVHDARLVAVMQARGILRVLTFNERDFRRYSNIIDCVVPGP